MNKEEFDQWFDSAFEESVRQSNSTPTPEADSSWHRVSQRLKLERRRKNRRRKWQMIVAVAASLFIGAFVFGNPQLIKAIEPIKAIISQISNDMVSIIYGEDPNPPSEDPGMRPPPDHSGAPEGVSPQPQPNSSKPVTETVQSRSGTLEEAKELALFPLYTPQYVRPDYELTSTDLNLEEKGRALDVTMTYEREDGDIYFISQSLLQPESVFNFKKNEEDTVTDVEVAKINGKLFEGSRKMLILFHGRTLIIIRGDMPVEDLYLIAESML